MAAPGIHRATGTTVSRQAGLARHCPRNLRDGKPRMTLRQVDQMGARAALHDPPQLRTPLSDGQGFLALPMHNAGCRRSPAIARCLVRTVMCCPVAPGGRKQAVSNRGCPDPGLSEGHDGAWRGGDRFSYFARAAQARTASPKASNSGRDTGSLAAFHSGCHWTDSVKPGAPST